jgi:hypothetical protein
MKDRSPERTICLERFFPGMDAALRRPRAVQARYHAAPLDASRVAQSPTMTEKSLPIT